MPNGEDWIMIRKMRDKGCYLRLPTLFEQLRTASSSAASRCENSPQR